MPQIDFSYRMAPYNSNIIQFTAMSKFILSLMLLPLTLALVQVDDPTNVRKYTSGGNHIMNGSALEKNLKMVLNSLVNNVELSGYNNTWIDGQGDPIHPLYGLAQCRGDLNASTCRACASYAKKTLREVCLQSAGRIHLDGCFLRYDTYNFFSKLDLSYESSVSQWCDNFKKNGTVENARGLDLRIDNLLTRVVENAVSSNVGYSTLNESGIYTLAQCWRDLSMNQCRQCLTTMQNYFGFCPPGTSQESILHINCMIRFAQYKFYSDGVPLLSRATDEGKYLKMLGFCIGGAVIVIVLVGVVVIWKRKVIQPSNEKQLPGTYDF